ncbi:MAG: transglycosylase SLT domain-containing protein [Proteobacteria bacterium]|nr:transglycosylase SLT domain-containing protein [Pseudomonadota bacterium]
MGVFSLAQENYRAALENTARSLDTQDAPSPAPVAPKSVTFKVSDMNTGMDALFDSAAEKYAPYAGVEPAVMSHMLKRLAFVESGGDPNIVNKTSGATGLLQIMLANFAALGIKNAKDPAENIQGAAYLLTERLRTHKGDWLKTVATYNGGGGHVQDGQWKQETLNYVNKIFGKGADQLLLSGGSVDVDGSKLTRAAPPSPRALERSSGLAGATDTQERIVQQKNADKSILLKTGLTEDDLVGLRSRAKLAAIDGQDPVKFIQQEGMKLIAAKKKAALEAQPIDPVMAGLDFVSRVATGPNKMINNVGYAIADQLGADKVAGYFKGNAEAMEALNAASDQSQFISNSVGRDIYRGFQSTAEQVLPAMGSGFNPAVMGVSGGLSQGGSAYNEARDAGLDKGDALANGIVQGGLEGIGDTIGAGAVAKVFKASGGKILNKLGRAVAIEPTQEMITQTGQSAMDQHYGTNGRVAGDWNEYADRLPADLQSAAIGGLVGAASFGGAGAAINLHAQHKARRDAALTETIDPQTGITQPLSAEQIRVATESGAAMQSLEMPPDTSLSVDEAGTPNQEALLQQLGGGIQPVMPVAQELQAAPQVDTTLESLPPELIAPSIAPEQGPVVSQSPEALQPTAPPEQGPIVTPSSETLQPTEPPAALEPTLPPESAQPFGGMEHVAQAVQETDITPEEAAHVDLAARASRVDPDAVQYILRDPAIHQADEAAAFTEILNGRKPDLSSYRRTLDEQSQAFAQDAAEPAGAGIDAIQLGGGHIARNAQNLDAATEGDQNRDGRSEGVGSPLGALDAEATRADTVNLQESRLADPLADNANTQADLVPALQSALGTDTTNKLIDSGRLQFGEVENGAQAKYDGETITLDPSKVGKDSALAVLLHEVSHASDANGGAFGQHYEAMQKTLSIWAKAKLGTPMGDFMAAVDERVQNSETTGENALKERLAYAVEEATSLGTQAPRTVREWLQSVVSAVKTQLAKLSVKFKLPLSPNLVTPALLVQLAKQEAGVLAQSKPAETRYSHAARIGIQGDEAPAPQSNDAANAADQQDGTPPREGWDLPEHSNLDEATAKIQNQLNRWRDVQRAIVEQGGKVSDASDIYGAMERMPGRAATRMDDFSQKEVRPLIERMAKGKIELGDIEAYLYALHAPERNERMQAINPDRADNEALSGMSNKDAADVIAEAKAQPNFGEFHDIASRMQDLTLGTQKMLVSGGLISQDQADAYNSAYAHYVPLKGFERADDADGRVSRDQKGKGFSPGITLRRATGRVSRAGDILANIVRDRELAVMAAEKNRVALTAAQFIADNPDADLWTIDKPEKQAVLANGTVQWRTKSQLGDGEFQIYVAGQKVRVQLHDAVLAAQFKKMNQEEIITGLATIEKYNRLLAQMWTAKNPTFIVVNPLRDFQAGLLQLSGEISAEAAAKATAYYLPSLKAAWEQAKNGTVKDPKMRRLMAQFRNNGGNTGAAWVGDLERTASNIERMLDDASGNNVARILNDVKSGNIWSATKQVAYKAVNNSLIDYIEYANSATENAFRLASFAAALDAGKTVAQAANIAKNVTVNFNRKGDMTPVLRTLFLFWNPAVQGATRIKEALVDSPHKKQVWAATGGLVALGMLQPLLWAMMGAGDDWDKIPESEKERNFIIPIGGGRRLNIPMPYGWGWFYQVGRFATEVVIGQKKPLAAAVNVFKSATQNFSPVGLQGELDLKNTMLAFTPTIVKAGAMVALNRNGFGSQLMPEGRFGVPDSQLMNRATRGTVYDEAAQMLNKVTGGNDYREGGVSVSPETLKLLVEYHLGGTGRFVAKSLESGGLAAQGESPDIEQMPFVSTFVKAEKLSDWKQAYFSAKREISQGVIEYEKNAKAGNEEGLMDAQTDFGDLIYLGGAVKASEKQMKNFNEQRQEIRSSEMSTLEKRAAEKILDKDEQEAMQQLLDVYKQNKPK